MSTQHIPVLLKDVIEYLQPYQGQNFIDCTFGQGGHSQAIYERIKPTGKILDIDANPDAFRNIKLQSSNFIVNNDNFVNLKNIYEYFFPYPVNGILFDLGLSTPLLKQSNRGFSFLKDEKLDMRFNPDKQRLTAAEVLNNYSLENLIRIFRDYGEYPRARQLSQNIIEYRRKRKLATTNELVELVSNLGFSKQRQKIHPATQVFQALRIEVNDELDNLVKALPQALDILVKGGRLVVISFHSLEDRIVKNILRSWAKQGKLELLTKKPVTASHDEVRLNPKSRSAKLRAAKKLSD